jgi:hypothetical protein
MRSAIFAVVITAVVGGFISSSDAQTPKKLPAHPDAAADQQGSSVPLPRNSSQAGQASSDQPKPKTSPAMRSGGQSNAGPNSK